MDSQIIKPGRLLRRWIPQIKPPFAANSLFGEREGQFQPDPTGTVPLYDLRRFEKISLCGVFCCYYNAGFGIGRVAPCADFQAVVRLKGVEYDGSAIRFGTLSGFRANLLFLPQK